MSIHSIEDASNAPSHSQRQTPPAGGGGGHDSTTERLAVIETKLGYLATDAKLQKSIDGLKIWILLGIIGAVPVVVGLILYAIRIFSSPVGS